MKEVMIPLDMRYANALIDNAEKFFLIHIDGIKHEIHAPCKCYVYQKDEIDPFVVCTPAANDARLGKVVCEFECQAVEYYTKGRAFSIFKNSRCRMLCSEFVVYDKPKELSEFGLKRAPKKIKVLKGERHEAETDTH